ncbi:MAG TPA: gas vesicle protein [Clostridiales bacterium]|nr:MAG: gas vesicle protein [Clostridiales bacterium GWD2_32_59]HAN10450.1 gas vesicle protein [Clostridiales bacterium]
MSQNRITHSGGGATLGDILERVLDKGVVIAGDISIAIADVELITIKIRLVVASVDKAMEMGIDWWKSDPTLSSRAYDKQLEDNKETTKQLEAPKKKKIPKKMERLAEEEW